jgi:hypothetical protein
MHKSFTTNQAKSYFHSLSAGDGGLMKYSVTSIWVTEWSISVELDEHNLKEKLKRGYDRYYKSMYHYFVSDVWR